jgi:hypothetical protein
MPRKEFRKPIDRWIYKYRGLDEEGAPRVRQRSVEVEVFLEKRMDESDEPPHPVAEVSFAVVCKEKGADFRLVGTDIEALRKAAWGQLDARFKVAWEEWFLVKVDPVSYIQGTGEGIEFSYANVWRGVAHDGTLLLREYDRYNSSSVWKISPWPGEFKNKNGRVIACIPATKANRKALEEFAEGVKALRARLADFLAPDKIERTLANLSGINLLPAPEGEEK